MKIDVIPAANAPRPDDRQCRVCHRTLRAVQFHGDGKHRRRVCRRCFADQERRKRAERGGKDRHPRYNARGDVWCNHCQHYLGAENFRRHPSRLHTYWAYCKSCTRFLDRERYARRTSTLEGALLELDKKNQRKRRLQRRVFAERRRLLQESILLLRKRGLTKAEIVRLTDTTFGNLLKWERAECQKPTRAVCDRFGIVVRETADLPISEPAYRRRAPHPAMGELLARCLPRVQAIPVRDAWKNGRRAA